MNQAFRAGTVYLVGAGPGDPSLLTLAAQRALAKADVVVYDHLVNSRILHHAPQARKIYVGKKGSHLTLEQREINELLLKEASPGKTVVRLKGGDPFVFGRGGEEAQALAEAGVPFRVIPGVTAGVSVPAYAGIPVTHRGLSSTVTFITGHEAEEKAQSTINWEALVALGGTLVFYMGAGRLRIITQNLIEAGLAPDTPSAFVHSGTIPRQRTITGPLSELADKVERASLSAPAIIIVGEVVELRNELRWYEQLPLFGKRILITRTRKQASRLAEALEAFGAEPVEFPLIQIEPVGESEELQRAIKDLNSYDWIIFTSANAVEIFMEALLARELDARNFAGTNLACIGSVTAVKLLDYGIHADLVPHRYIAEEIAKALGDVSSLRILLPRADKARPYLKDELERRGAVVDNIIIYHTTFRKPTSEELESLRYIDLVTFTSPSTVENFVRVLQEEGVQLEERVLFASIGPITTLTARKLGLSIHIESPVHTTEDLVSAILAYYEKGRPAR